MFVACAYSMHLEILNDFVRLVHHTGLHGMNTIRHQQLDCGRQGEEGG